MDVMCGRFAMDKETDLLVEEFVAVGGNFHDWRPGWNIRPTDPVATVFETANDGQHVRRLEPARWALTPGWSTTLKTKVPMFNARSETVTERSSFAASVRSQRAIIPASGYYEWQTDPQTKKKTPFYLRPRDNTTMALAGIYSWWKDRALPDGHPCQWTLTTTILTSDAVETLANIHNRNPVPLPREWWDDWLDPTIDGDQSFVDAAVAAAVPVANALVAVRVVAVTDEHPVQA